MTEHCNEHPCPATVATSASLPVVVVVLLLVLAAVLCCLYRLGG